MRSSGPVHMTAGHYVCPDTGGNLPFPGYRKPHCFGFLYFSDRPKEDVQNPENTLEMDIQRRARVAERWRGPSPHRRWVYSMRLYIEFYGLYGESDNNISGCEANSYSFLINISRDFFAKSLFTVGPI